MTTRSSLQDHAHPPGTLVFDNLTLGYHRHPAVHHLHAQIAPGTLTALVGPNGAGKSTLLKGIMGALRPLDGRIDLGGLKRADIAYLPQQTDIDRSFPVSVFDMVAMGLWRTMGAFRTVPENRMADISATLETVGLAGYEGTPVGSLSGGQMQRALFARLMLQDAPVILLDEPFNAIDARTVADLLQIVHDWHRDDRTVIAVLHDIDQVRRHFPDCLLLARELVAMGPTADVLTPENLRHARALCEAFDEDAPLCDRAPDLPTPREAAE